MRKLLVMSLLAGLASAADDPWAKVRELKSGSELKLWKKGASQPVDAVYDQLTEEKLLVVMKNEQVAIPLEGVDRIDARPSTKGTKPKAESTVSRDVERPERAAAPPRSMREGQPGAPTMSSSTSMSWGKPGFETVYRRGPSAPAKK
jgi:hypothetical protein